MESSFELRNIPNVLLKTTCYVKSFSTKFTVPRSPLPCYRSVVRLRLNVQKSVSNISGVAGVSTYFCRAPGHTAAHFVFKVWQTITGEKKSRKGYDVQYNFFSQKWGHLIPLKLFFFLSSNKNTSRKVPCNKTIYSSTAPLHNSADLYFFNLHSWWLRTAQTPWTINAEISTAFLTTTPTDNQVLTAVLLLRAILFSGATFLLTAHIVG